VGQDESINLAYGAIVGDELEVAPASVGLALRKIGAPLHGLSFPGKGRVGERDPAGVWQVFSWALSGD
jgi:hypothetical protein